jgi:hypothetical protein
LKIEGNPLRRIGVFLVRVFRLDRPGKGNRELHQELIALAGGRRDAVREYYVRKTEQVILVLLVGGIAVVAGCVAAVMQERSISDQILERPGYGEGDRSEELTVQINGAQEQTLEITIQERQYTVQEQDTLLEQAVSELETLIQGENPSMDEVRQSLVFPSTLQNGAVSAEWVTIPYGVIDDDGSILGTEEEEGTLVEIQGTLSCGEKETFYTAYARVFPVILTDEERLYRAIQEEAGAADQRDRYTDSLSLPSEADGSSLVWEYPVENPAQTLIALTLLICVCIYAGRDQMIHRRAEERRSQLAIDYPDMIWKMAMLIEAGLTIKGTFIRIAAQYQNERSHGTRYAYEEIVGTCYEMQSGIPEAESYERFGHRCELPEYIRLGSYLAQNLKKGSRGLTAFLEQEASASLEERKNHARKIGEQAGTKMLFPMILMLGVVLVILMVPAFLSF